MNGVGFGGITHVTGNVSTVHASNFDPMAMNSLTFYHNDRIYLLYMGYLYV